MTINNALICIYFRRCKVNCEVKHKTPGPLLQKVSRFRVDFHRNAASPEEGRRDHRVFLGKLPLPAIGRWRHPVIALEVLGEVLDALAIFQANDVLDADRLLRGDFGRMSGRARRGLGRRPSACSKAVGLTRSASSVFSARDLTGAGAGAGAF